MRKFFMLIAGLVLIMLQSFAQTKTGTIEGHVFTSEGKPVEDANVEIKELNKFTRTNNHGGFRFKNIPYGNYTLVYSYAGTGAQNINVTVPPEEGVLTNYNLALNNKQLEEVIVSARKGINNGRTSIGKANIPVMDLPQSVVTISESTIELQQAQRLSDVMKNVNGMYLGTTRGATQEAFYARGYNFGNNNMFKNGFRVNTGTMPEMSSLESVEILKGSAAILYGNVAPGGIVNMVTKKPKFNLGGAVNMRAGSFGLWKPSVDVYGPFSNNIAYRINGTFETAKSYRDVVASKRYYVNPSLLFKLGHKTDLLVQGDYLKHDFTPDFGIGTLNGFTIADVPRSRFMGAPWQYTHTQQITTSAELNHKLNDSWQLNAGLSYQNYHRDYFSIERIQADATGKWKRPLGKFDNKEKYYTGQANLTGKFNTGKIHHNLLIGLDADRYLTENLTSDITGKIYDSINLLDPSMYVRRTDMPVANWTSKATIPVTRFGVYLQDLISISEKLKVLAGARWSYQQSYATKTETLSNGNTVLTGRQVDRAFSPRVGLVYQPAKSTSLFVSYTNSFSPNTGMQVDSTAIPPSIIDQFEAGIKNIFFDGKLNVNLTAYRIINNNLAQMVFELPDGRPNTNTQIKALTGQTTSDGLEFDVRAFPLKGLDVIAGYAYNNMRYTKTSGKTGSFVEGQRLVNTPAHTGNFTAFYSFCTGSLKGLRLGTGYYYVGKRNAGWNDDYTNNNGAIRKRLFEVGGFSTIDFSAGYTYKNLSLMAKLSNITNTYNYYVHENYSINPIPPRNFVITVGYKF